MYEIKKVGLISAGWVLSGISVVVYIILTIVSLLTEGINLGFSDLFLSIILGIILVEVFSFLLGIFLAWLYNKIAKKWGGLLIDFRHIKD